MAFDLTTAIVSHLAGRVFASSDTSLGSIASCAGGTVAVLARLCALAVIGPCPDIRGQGSRTKAVDDQRGACHRARISAPHPCIRLVHRDQTMMQSCASAAKLRGGGPILDNGVKPWPASGDRHLGSSAETGAILFVRLQKRVLLSLHAAGRKTTPSGTSPVVAKRHSAMSSFLARATIRVLRVRPRASAVRARYHCASALSF